MVSVDEALQLVLQQTQRQPIGLMPMTSAILGLVLAEDIVSDIDVPPFDKSLMDGYALRSGDAKSGGSYLIIEEIMAGMVPTKTVGTMQASRIMTGAPIPAGADTVIPQEKVTRAGPSIQIQDSNAAGKNILPLGTEMKRGDVVLQAGHVLRPPELGLLATVGRTEVQVYLQPNVAILSTGDEIVEPSGKLKPGQIRNSNSSMLAGQVVQCHARPTYLGIAEDKKSSLEPLIREGIRSDILLISGGVSVGAHDLIPSVLQEQGVTPIFHQVRMKPGRPLFFGTKGRTLVFGLPGNPVAGLVGFELFVRSALRKMMGYLDCEPAIGTVRLTKEHTHKSDRPTYHPVRLQWNKEGLQATVNPWFGSPDLRSICQSDGFAIFPPGEVKYAAGETIHVLRLA